MGTQRNAVEWEFLLDQRQLDRGLKKSRDGFAKTDKSSNTLKDSMGKLTKAAGALGLAMGAKAILQFGKDSIDAAADYEESVNAVKVLSGDAATEILKIGESAAESFGLSRTEFNDTAIAFAGFNDQLDSIEPAQTFEDFIARASDFASVVNIDVKDAVKLFSSTLAGESEPIRRYGKNLSAAAVQAYAVESGISAVGATMSEQEKVQARYGLLMQETAEFAGDFANTSDDAAGKTKILTAKLADQQVLLGQELLPVYADLLTIALDLAPAMSGISESIASTIQPVADLTGVVANLSGSGDDAFWSMDTLGGALNGAMGVAEKLNPLIGGTVWAMNNLGFETRYAAEGADDVAESVAGTDDALTRGTDAAGDFGEAVGDAEQAVRDFSDTEQLIKDVEDGIKEMTDAEEAALDVFDLLKVEAAKKLGALRKEWDSTTGRVSAYEQAVKDSIAQLDIMAGRVPQGGFETGTGQPGLASGGRVAGGRAITVGEHGRETFIPGADGTIIPNGGVRGSSGGGGATINITVNALDPDAAAVAVADAIRSYRDRYGEI